MANWRSFGDRMMHCHLSMLKIWCNCSNPARFHTSSAGGGGGGGGGLLLGGGCFKNAAAYLPIRRSSSSPSVSTRSLTSSPLLMLPPKTVVCDHNNSSEKYDGDGHYCFHFFNLCEQSQFRVRKNLSVPWQRDVLMPDDARCVGSSHGWLAFNHPRNCHSYLYNPLIDSPHFPYIALPSVETIHSVRAVRNLKADQLSPSPTPITQFLILIHENYDFNADRYEVQLSSKGACNYFVRRVVMSSAPSVPCYSSSLSTPQLDGGNSGDNCTIMALHSASDDIAFCKPGDDRWTVLDVSLRAYSDITYFSKDQRFYAMRGDYSMEAWDLREPSCPKQQVFNRPDFCHGKVQNKIRESYNWAQRDYLVESSGDLLLVCRFLARNIDEDDVVHPRRLEERAVKDNINDEEWENNFIHDDDAYWTLGFDVHKFDSDHNKWEPVECLGDRALFVGSNHSFSLSARDYPELAGNSIYVADDYFRGFNDTYRGHDNGVFHLENNCMKPYYPNRLKIIDPIPVWVAPNTM